MTYGLTLTTAGITELETAYLAGEVVKIPAVAFGDGGGAAVTSDPETTALAGQLGEVPLTAGTVGTVLIGGTAIIPCKDYPGAVIREFGLISEAGTLIAYGAYPDTYLPNQGDSIVKEVVIKFIMPLTYTECVELVIDPNIAVITVEEGDKRYYRQSLRLKEVADAGTDAQAEARTHLDVYSKTESDERFLNASENLADVPDKAAARANLDIYSKEEGDGRYQPKGNYTPAGEAYTKTESDERFLNASENLADVPDKAAARANLDIFSKEEGDGRYQPIGNYTPAGEAYTRAESDGRYLQNMQLGAQVSIGKEGDHDQTYQCPPGCMMTAAFVSDGDGREAAFTTAYYKPMQKNINGTWVTISG